ncbi:MAG TPA: hypothetical protein VFJ82_14440 [Longimicrobium sp.]|nr:hypothetical protein [Longimicrobium sp.]
MIRFARMVLMLAFALAQAAAVECPMAPAAHPHASAHHAMGAKTDGHHPGAPASRHTHDAQDHGAAACVLVMACGTAAAASAEISVPRPALAATPSTARAAVRYASPHLPIDAPPPRPAAA